MLYLLKTKKKAVNKIYIGDKLNLIYRFNGVFFVIMGYCVFKRQKSIGIYSKKKSFFFFFCTFLFNVREIYKFNTFFFHNIKWKNMYRISKFNF